MPNGENKNNISTIYYVLFSVENLIITILVIYLVMSSFNKKTVKETFVNKDKILIYVLGSIILTIGLTYLMSFLTTLNNKIIQVMITLIQIKIIVILHILQVKR